jgi:hypothetical protein
MFKLRSEMEYKEQQALVKWMSLHPILRDNFYKNHNEGKRTARQGSNLKRLGLISGVMDIFTHSSKSLPWALY